MMEEEKNNVENSAEPTGDQVADLQSSGDQAADAQPSAAVPLQPDKPLSGKELRRQKKKPLQRKRLKLPHRKHGKKPRQKRRRHARRRNRSLRSCSAARRKKNTGRVSVRNADRK
ncbi:MAG: hypothetical protein ACLR8X_09730 [Gallintestinimicrobium sp.]